MWKMLPALVLLVLANSDRAAALSVGDDFPQWNLFDQSGAPVTSMGYTGRSYVLWFYPAAMTPGCTAEGRNFREYAGAFTRAGVEIIGVSADSPEVNALFAQAEQFPFQLLSDPGHRLARRAGAIDLDAEEPRPRRMTFLVGADGRVIRIYRHVNPVRHAQEILLDLGAPLE